MLLTVDSKADLNGKDIYVPHLRQLRKKDRNKVSRYVGWLLERDDSPLIPLILLTGFLGPILVGLIIDNGYVAFSGVCFVTLACIVAIITMIMQNVRKPPEPKVAIVRMDDIRWSMLLVAFKDDHELWERLIETIRMEKYGSLEYESQLSRDLNEVVSAYMMNVTPTAEAAHAVQGSVGRIFAEYDRQQAEAQAIMAARREVKSLGAKQLFDAQVEMAEQDAARQAIAAPFTY
jgi:hypothetical protein